MCTFHEILLELSIKEKKWGRNAAHMGKIKGMHRLWTEKSEGKIVGERSGHRKVIILKIYLEDIEWESMDRTYFIQDRKERRNV